MKLIAELKEYNTFWVAVIVTLIACLMGALNVFYEFAAMMGCGGAIMVVMSALSIILFKKDITAINIGGDRL